MSTREGKWTPTRAAAPTVILPIRALGDLATASESMGAPETVWGADFQGGLAQWGPLPDRRQISEASDPTTILLCSVFRYQTKNGSGIKSCMYVHRRPFVHIR